MCTRSDYNHPVNREYNTLLGSLRNPNSNTVAYVIKLKKKLSTKEKIVNFLSENSAVYCCLLDSLKNSIYQLKPIEVSVNDVNYDKLVKELTNVIANCCHYSIASLTTFKSHMVGLGFDIDALRVLESNVDTSVKTSMLRLLGNLADYRETASIPAQPNLLERIAIIISLNNTESDSAARVVRLLTKHRIYIRHSINANVALNIGLLISKRDLPAILKDPNLLTTLKQLSHSYNFIRDVGRQLGQSHCTEKLLEIMLEDPSIVVEKWQQLILNLTRYSCDLRVEFGQKTIVEVVARQKLSRSIVLFLSYFAHDVWGRKTLRVENALQVILERLAATDSIKEQSEILTSLKFFIYDPEGVSIICHRSEATNLCINAMKYFLEKASSIPHDPEGREYYGEEDQLENAARGDLTPARNEFIDKKHINPQFIKYSISSPSNTSCQSLSPKSNHSMSLSPSTSPVRSVDDLIFMSADVSNVECLQSNSEDDDLSRAMDEEKPYKDIISDCIEIFAWLTHHENGAEFLVDETILRTLLLFLSKISAVSIDRLLRLVCRIIKSRLYLDKILDLQLPVMIASILIRQPCLTKRFSVSCLKCFQRARFGREILAELILQTDSAFGIGILEKDCARTDDRLIYALLNGLALLRLVDHRNRFIQRWKPVQTILAKVSDTLLNSDLESIKNNRLLIEIFDMLSLLVSRRYFSKLVGPAQPYCQEENAKCELRIPKDDEPQIEFTTKTGHMLSVRIKDLSISKTYFQGMIRHETSGGQSQKLTFTFDPERDEADEDDFIKFLHYLCGCRGSCVSVEDAKTCVALLHLSDKYSCIELAEELLRSNGPARRFIDGSNIVEFLPVILSSWLYRDRFGYVLALVFMKFTNEEQQRQVFCALANNRMGVEEFIALISSFFERINRLVNSGFKSLPIDFV